MTWLPQKALTLGELASDRPQGATPVTGEGELSRPGPGREKGPGMLEPLLACVGVPVRSHRMPITLSQLSPREHSPVFTLPPKSVPYLRVPLKPSTQSWVGQEREGPGLGQRNLPSVVSGL